MKYVLTNWKMYLDRSREADLFDAVQARLRERFGSGSVPASVIVCPSFVSLVPLHATMDPGLVRLGAQNCHWESEGPFTGEVSPTSLQGLVDFVLVGHSERRAAGETDEQIAKKVAATAAAGLTPILLVGEDEPTDAAFEQTNARLTEGLEGVDLSRHEVVVVYEPTYAIGAHEAAPTDHIEKVVEQVKDRLAELGAEQPRVIYGGTVNADNVDELARLEVLDGVGAGRAALDPDEFLDIVERVAQAGARRR
ncbi:MAG: triose-phosphate isomerase [Actinomycetota bacterium]|nr:triose-phosphate isomerase [Actinomycetota bacterium]